jgi:hypothetical protein
MSHSNIHMLLDKIIHPGAPIQEIDLQPRLRGIHAPGDFWTDPKKKGRIFTSVKIGVYHQEYI